MLLKIISLPFKILFGILGNAAHGLTFILSSVFKLLEFVLSRVFGTVFGALAGLLLGKKHVQVKLFTHKR